MTFKKGNLNIILQAIVTFFALCSVFLAGSMHPDTNFERIAEYSSQVVKKSTANKKYAVVAFDAPNKAGDYYGTELSNLFDVFRSGVVTYGSAMNVDKKLNIRLESNEENSLSLFFVGAVGSKKFENETASTKTYRHNQYSIFTMFDDPKYNGTDFDKKHSPVIYLSKKQAENILKNKGYQKEADDDFSEEQYYSLLLNPVTLNIEGDDCQYIVWNIFYNNDFYCDGLSDVLGEYALTSYYQPESHDLRQIHKSLYFFNEYSYYNQYLMRYLNERFTDDNLKPELVKNNIIRDVNDEYFLSFFHNKSIYSLQWAFTLLIVNSLAMLSLSVFLFFKNHERLFLDFLISAISLLLPYCIFKIIYLILGDIIFFSQAACKLNALFIALYAISLISILFFTKLKKAKALDESNDSSMRFYEVTI